MSAYYNEIDPYCAQWLRNLIDAGHIAPGVVEERSIEDIAPNELNGYAQCHFFAGIGVWSYALRLAGWPDDRPVWTGSCPCQPFSAAGKGHGFADERHLWPAWFHLIRERMPAVIFGEQVASRDGLDWLDLVQADMEGADYACGAIDLCAAGVGAPHIRQRLWFVGERMDDATGARRIGPLEVAEIEARDETRLRVPGARGGSCGMADANGAAGQRGAGGVFGTEAAQRGTRQRHGCQPDGPEHGRETRSVADPNETGLCEQRRSGLLHGKRSALGDDVDGRGAHGALAHAGRPGSPEQRGRRNEPARPASPGFWSDADWLPCRDGKFRPVEPGTFPLAYGVANRVGRLRAYGNAINAEAAAAVIRAYAEARRMHVVQEAA